MIEKKSKAPRREFGALLSQLLFHDVRMIRMMSTAAQERMQVMTTIVVAIITALL